MQVSVFPADGQSTWGWVCQKCPSWTRREAGRNTSATPRSALHACPSTSFQAQTPTESASASVSDASDERTCTCMTGSNASVTTGSCRSCSSFTQPETATAATAAKSIRKRRLSMIILFSACEGYHPFTDFVAGFVAPADEKLIKFQNRH